MARRLYTLLGLIAMVGCHRAQDSLVQTLPIQPPFLQADSVWVDSVLSTLSMEERMAQLLMVPIYAKEDTAGWHEAEHWARDLKLGGVICMQGGPNHQRHRLRRLQALSEVPLMVASDAEWGLGMRLDSTRSFPRAMTLGATRNPELVRMFGQVVGNSLRATGVHVNFAPVIDVNSNPINPVIGSRSFGETVDWVGQLGQAYADGLQDVHVLATAKHFPGHGDSDSDSHATLPTISHDRARLDSVELAPFAYVFNRGMGAVMVAHLDIPGLDSTEAQPSTLSPLIVDSLLRGTMGFKGLVFTDAMSMKGFADFVGERPRIRDALLAGNDVLLFPGNPVEAIEEAMNALSDGTLDSAMVTDKCKRVLQAKWWSQAFEPVPSRDEPWEPIHADVIHRELIAQSLTVLPWADSSAGPWLENQGHLVMLDVANHAYSCQPLEDQLRSHLGSGWSMERHILGKDGSGCGRDEVLRSLNQASRVLVTVSEMSHRPSRNFGVQPEGLNAVSELLASQAITPSMVSTVWMGNPYALKHFELLSKRSGYVMVAYQDDERTCHAVADALAGVCAVSGRLPVSPDGTPHVAGDGVDWAGPMRLGRPLDGRLQFWNRPAQAVDTIIQLALDEGALPGGRVVIAHRGQIVIDKAFGSLDGDRPVSKEAIYDLASITKVAATSMALMKLQELGDFELAAEVGDLLIELNGHDLGDRTAREFLTHQAGLEPWIPFYIAALEDSSGVFGMERTDGCDIPVAPGLYMEDAFSDSVWNMILTSELNRPGKYKYSDLGFYIWQKFLNQRGIQLDDWVMKSMCEPMGWGSMGFLPLDRGMSPDLIAPTERDEAFRQCVVHGTVHDPGAAMLGGVGCHAGLFSNAYDLVELGELWLRGGSLRGISLVNESILHEWTQRGFPEGDNRRGIGFDKPALEPDSGPTCDLASWESFGHTGFTGTLLWVDPAYDLVYVFLSNRTYPDASNTKLLRLDTRTEIQRVVLEHLGAESRFQPEHD